jgi:hypothetical protein
MVGPGVVAPYVVSRVAMLRLQSGRDCKRHGREGELQTTRRMAGRSCSGLGRLLRATPLHQGERLLGPVDLR